ncbi:hypothetical protein B0F90DRAFT_1402409 [Multifurca ochricompacta]|uniref:Uncharacterized protein n=1 Tax=Multifurca ochricompacta TaxID=376703 RepID=A0AAD4LYY0_9AGAM|nr:hypothetical protein B0F90DRAFT_1402409 [Multifurca ochricompacta]
MPKPGADGQGIGSLNAHQCECEYCVCVCHDGILFYYFLCFVPCPTTPHSYYTLLLLPFICEENSEFATTRNDTNAPLPFFLLLHDSGVFLTLMQLHTCLVLVTLMSSRLSFGGLAGTVLFTHKRQRLDVGLSVNMYRIFLLFGMAIDIASPSCVPIRFVPNGEWRRSKRYQPREMNEIFDPWDLLLFFLSPPPPPPLGVT